MLPERRVQAVLHLEQVRPDVQLIAADEYCDESALQYCLPLIFKYKIQDQTRLAQSFHFIELQTICQ